MEIHQKKLIPDYHKLKTMAKMSVEQHLRTRNFEDRIGRIEKCYSIIRGNSVVFTRDMVIVVSGKP